MAKVNMNSTAQNSPLIREIKRSDGTIPKLLWDLLHLATPKGTEQYIVDLFPFKDKGMVDKEGNFIIVVGDKEFPETMFSSHMDTVHELPKELKEKNIPGYIRLLTMSDEAKADQKGYIWAGVKKPNEQGFVPCVLGADDKAGVFIMCELIRYKVPGLYIFHTGEECGADGSKYSSKEYKHTLLKNVKRCIAFDRKGYTDVITFQRSSRKCSKEFGAALAKALNENISLHEYYHYKSEQSGTFTDSANYSDVVSECVNLSIGYFDQHTSGEKLDYLWLLNNFLPAAVKVKWDELPTVRVKGAYESQYGGSNYNYGGNTYYGGYAQTNRNSGWGSAQYLTPYWEITKHTTDRTLPVWKPEDGYIITATREGMARLVSEWLARNYAERGEFVEGLMFRNEELEIELLDAREQLKALKELVGIDDPQEEVPLLLEAPKDNVLKFPERTNDNLPASKDFWEASVVTKVELLNAFIAYKDANYSKLPRYTQDAVVRSARIFRKITKRSKKETTTRVDYIALNRLILEFTELYSAMPDDFKNDEVKTLLKGGMTYIALNQAEPGFEALQEKQEEVVHAG